MVPWWPERETFIYRRSPLSNAYTMDQRLYNLFAGTSSEFAATKDCGPKRRPSSLYQRHEDSPYNVAAKVSRPKPFKPICFGFWKVYELVRNPHV